MKALVGTMLGVVAVGGLLIGYGAGRGAFTGTQTTGYGMTVGDPGVAGGFGAPTVGTSRALTPAGPILVRCEPGQRALVRHTVSMPVSGEALAEVECIGQASAPAYVDRDGRPVQVVFEEGYRTYPLGARAVPAVTSVEPAPRAIASRRVVYEDVPARRVVRRTRSWQKSALIIGGSTGAGAGVGALVGGKKGAAIGAAIGGGSAALYEATRAR